MLQARIEVLHPQFWADAAFGGTTSAGEAYIHGLWKCDDLTALVRILVANRDVHLTVAARTVHAIVGENGAGKSTLMKTLAGVHRADAGEVWIAGERIETGRRELVEVCFAATDDAERVKAIEATTNHDVKAVEYMMLRTYPEKTPD